MEKRNKCYIYMRVSTAAQIDGYSLDAQKERLTEFAEYRELTIAGEYCDAGRSGHDVKGRPEFRKMLDDIASEKDGISYVLVFKLSRFGRNAADVLRSLQLIQDYGADLVSVEEGIDSSTQGGKLMLSLLSAVAEIERENINVQFLSGRIQKIREGGWGGGTAPFGYRLTDQGLVPDPEEAGMVRTMYSIFLREGAGWSTAAREMNDMGLSRTYRGRTVPFTASFVKVIILNPVNAGYVHFGLRSDRRDTIIAKGSHEALIPEETWQQAKAKAAAISEKSRAKEKRTRQHLLSGIIRCPVCGAGLVGTTDQKVNPNHGGMYADMHYYVCRYHRKCEGRTCSFGGRVKQEKADEAVREAIQQVMNTDAFRKAIEERFGEQDGGPDREEALRHARGRLRRIREEQAALMDAQDTLDILSNDYEDRYDALQGRIDGLYDDIDRAEEEIRALNGEGRDGEKRRLDREQVMHFLGDFDRIWEKMDAGERKEYFRTFLDRVEIFEKPEEGRLLKSITFRIPVGEKNGSFQFTLDCTALPKSRAESKATYGQIKAFVMERHGAKVSTLNISQIKRRMGLPMGRAYNKPEKNQYRVPGCTPEKAAYILEALKYFRMVPEDAVLGEEEK